MTRDCILPWPCGKAVDLSSRLAVVEKDSADYQLLFNKLSSTYNTLNKLYEEKKRTISDLQQQLQAEKDASLRLEERCKQLEYRHARLIKKIVDWHYSFHHLFPNPFTDSIPQKEQDDTTVRNEKPSGRGGHTGVPIDSYDGSGDVVDREQVATSGMPVFFQDDDQPDVSSESSPT